MLEFTPNATAELGDYGFQVTASYGFGDASFYQHGDGYRAGDAHRGRPGRRHQLTWRRTGSWRRSRPPQASAGQGTSAAYVVQLTNTGSADDTFALAIAGLPPGVTASFGQTTIDVPPGVEQLPG